jgi:hypothetical protein
MRRWGFTTYDGLVVLTEQRSIAHLKLLAELSRRERLPVLHSLRRHESYPVSSATTAEQGALGVAACRSGNGERR